jgi:phage shock protein A
MQLEYVRGEIERLRTQVHRQRREIRQLQRAGISTASAEALLERMLTKIDELCAVRDLLKKEHGPATGKVLGGRSW